MLALLTATITRQRNAYKVRASHVSVLLWCKSGHPKHEGLRHVRGSYLRGRGLDRTAPLNVRSSHIVLQLFAPTTPSCTYRVQNLRIAGSHITQKAQGKDLTGVASRLMCVGLGWSRVGGGSWCMDSITRANHAELPLLTLRDRSGSRLDGGQTFMRLMGLSGPRPSPVSVRHPCSRVVTRT
jgi:hypothetical protein